MWRTRQESLQTSSTCPEACWEFTGNFPPVLGSLRHFTRKCAQQLIHMSVIAFSPNSRKIPGLSGNTDPVRPRTSGKGDSLSLFSISSLFPKYLLKRCFVYCLLPENNATHFITMLISVETQQWRPAADLSAMNFCRNYSAPGSALDNMLAICWHLCFLPLIDRTPTFPAHRLTYTHPPPRPPPPPPAPDHHHHNHHSPWS